MLSYSHFTQFDREFLQQLLEKKYSIREIARNLGRSPSSVSREMRRNSFYKGGYSSCYATKKAAKRRALSKVAGKLFHSRELYNFIVEKLGCFWSPEIISARWNKSNPKNPVAFSSIYRWLEQGFLQPRTP
jgi:IS30 family transposase